MENNYKEYLESYAWKAIKKTKLEEQPNCECCGEPATSVHHLSYERRGSEREDDIVSICERCHHECHFVNGYQIKNDEAILRKRFEEVREEFWGDNNFSIEGDNIIYNGEMMEIISSNFIEFKIGYPNDYHIESFKSIHKYKNNICVLVDYEYSFNPDDDYGDHESNYIENDGSYHPEFDGYGAFENIEDESDYMQNDKLKNRIGLTKVFSKVDYIDQYNESGSVIYKLNIDFNTFEIYDKYFIRDKNFIYYKFMKLEGVDSATFGIIDKYFIRDKNNIYNLNGERIIVSDVSTFQFLEKNYYLDKYHVYKRDLWGKISKIEYFNSRTFKVLNDYYTGDDKSIFYDEKEIVGINVNSFSIISGKYIKDKFNIFYEDKIIDGVDISTFEVLDYKHSKDKNYVYLENEKLKLTSTHYNKRTEEKSIYELGFPDPNYFTKEIIMNGYINCIYKKD